MNRFGRFETNPIHAITTFHPLAVIADLRSRSRRAGAGGGNGEFAHMDSILGYGNGSTRGWLIDGSF